MTVARALGRCLPGVLAVTLALAPRPAAAQLEPPRAGGLAELARELRAIGAHRRVLVIAAHPDDEDTELLTVLTRRMGCEAAYLSLSRGEGGQNLLGPELGEALGVIRTEELLAARRVDGARQYFTRAFDFGYSKTLDETFRMWPRDTLVKDVVRVIRRFRPQVVVAIFSGTPRDGHGQHQASAVAAREAFDAAGDPTRFPELITEEGLAPFAPLKLFRSTRFDSAGTTTVLESGVLDATTGQSFHQIAMQSRSLHRSQDMGRLQQIGPATVRLGLVVDRTGQGGRTVFDGIDTTLADLFDAVRRPGSAPVAARPEYVRLDSLVRVIRARTWEPPSAELFDLLVEARRLVSALAPTSAEQGIEVRDLLAHLDRAACIAGGIVLDGRSGAAEVAPGSAPGALVSVWNAGPRPLEIRRLGVEAAGGFRAAPFSGARTVAPGQVDSVAFALTVEPEASPTGPYFLNRPRNGALYDWSTTPPALRGEPFEPPGAVAVVELANGVTLRREVTFRGNDQASGEYRRPLVIVPRVTAQLSPATEFWPIEARGAREFRVTLANGSRDSVSGTVHLDVPDGWPAVAPRPFRLLREGQTQTLVFRVLPPARPVEERVTITARAVTTDGHIESASRTVVSYPHIRPRALVSPAESRVIRARLALPPVKRVAYLRGAADRVPEALIEVGVPIELIDGGRLLRGDLARYDAIVIGPRAYETDSSIGAANDQLLAYARAGGLVVVQYQQYGFFNGGFAPYPMTVGNRPPVAVPGAPPPSIGGVALQGGHDRVTDETAPVVLLRPDDPVFTRPNRITPSDWDGWVQERGLYFAHAWDPRYRTLLETHDPGEPPLQGGLLIASVGKGTYVYTGLAFFRQLPAGVPGAFRLFANLLGLTPGGR